MRFLLLLISTLTGCFLTQESMSLAELHPRLHFYGTWEVMMVDLEFDDSQLPMCGVFATSFHAEINGSPLTAQLPWINDKDYCLSSPIQFSHEDPPATPAQVVFRDDSLTMTADVGDSYVRRSLAVIGGSVLRFGTKVTVRLGPATDLTPYHARVTLQQPDLEHNLYPPITWSTDAVAIEDDLVRFELPLGVLEPRSAKLRVDVTVGENTTTDTGTLPCVNTTCTQSIGRTGGIEVVLE